MDQTAFTLCRENDIIIVFDINKEGNLERIATGEEGNDSLKSC